MVSSIDTSNSNNYSCDLTTKATDDKTENFSKIFDDVNKSTDNTQSPTITDTSDTSNAKSDSSKTASNLVKKLKSVFTDISACPKCGAIYIGKTPPAVCTKCGANIKDPLKDKTKETNSTTNDAKSVNSTNAASDTTTIATSANSAK